MTEPRYRITNEYDYVIASRLFDRYSNRIVHLVAPNGETIMGCVPHEIHHPLREVHLKRSFFDPYAKD